MRIICVLAFSFCLSNSYSIILQIWKNCSDLGLPLLISGLIVLRFFSLSKNICITSNEFGFSLEEAFRVFITEIDWYDVFHHKIFFSFHLSTVNLNSQITILKSSIVYCCVLCTLSLFVKLFIHSKVVFLVNNTLLHAGGFCMLGKKSLSVIDAEIWWFVIGGVFCSCSYLGRLGSAGGTT